MTARDDKDHMTLLEKTIFKMFESNCVEFLLYLLREIPSINTYLHQINRRTGWLPIFRILNIFQSKNYTEEPIKK